MKDLLQQADNMQQEMTQLGNQLRIAEKRERLERLQEQMNQPGFWHDREKAAGVAQQAEGLRAELEGWDRLRQELADVRSVVSDAIAEGDEALRGDVEKQLAQLQASVQQQQTALYFSGPYDAAPAIVSLSAGVGGADAADWTAMLLRMYLRYCEKKGWQATVLDTSAGNEAGLKSATFRVAGDRAYGHLRAEAGVHRLVRQSPFNADHLRQTSFALVDVMPEFPEVVDIIVPEEELRIDVYRSGGKGGQSVNTTDSAVRIVHVPTGITVTCQNERSQIQNKAAAMQVLKARLFQHRLEAQDQTKKALRGNVKSAAWGDQIRSYVLHPYQMVKDHRTDYETSDTQGVLDGEIGGFVEAYLKQDSREIDQ